MYYQKKICLKLKVVIGFNVVLELLGEL